MEAFWGAQEQGTASELARLCGVSFAAAYSELEALKEAGLLKVTYQGTQAIYAANEGHEKCRVLRELVATERTGSSETEATIKFPIEDQDRAVRVWLREIGAPLLVEGRTHEALPGLEKILAAALCLAHRDATIARILPVCLWLKREQLDLERLEVYARRLGETQALGFFLSLTGELSGAQDLSDLGERFRDKRRKKVRAFFKAADSKYNQALAEKNTPELAKHWCFRMNMGLDSFKAAFDRFAYGHEHLPA